MFKESYVIIIIAIYLEKFNYLKSQQRLIKKWEIVFVYVKTFSLHLFV